jgi:ATP-dependent DNA helicase Q1
MIKCYGWASLIHEKVLFGLLSSVDADPHCKYPVRAVSLTGDLTKSEKEASYRALWKFQRGNNQNEQVHLCYVTPEAALHPRFTELLTRMYSRGKLDRIVIDEGHCMLESDHFFRPQYKKLGSLRDLLPNLPIQILTATCTSQDCSEIMKTMRMLPETRLNWNGTIIYRQSSYRRNLHYSVVPKLGTNADVFENITIYIKTNYRNQSGIVYCFHRKTADDLVKHLNAKGIKAAPYHGGKDLDKVKRNETQQNWYANTIQVICATHAFGLGIDKPDVRFVIHHSMAVRYSHRNTYKHRKRTGRKRWI